MSKDTPYIDDTLNSQGLRTHMEKIYALMALAMVITGAVAWGVAGLSVDEQGYTALGSLLFESPLKWALIFSPLLVVLVIGWGADKLSPRIARSMFIGFSCLMGISMSAIFIAYTDVAIAQAFLITAIAFLSLSIYGYSTKKNISGFQSFLLMGVVGVIVAMIVNIFIGSTALEMAISVVGILVFAGLTAVETQMIKTTYLEHEIRGDQEWLDRAAVISALSLYLNFINMFQFILSFGDE